MDYKHARKLHNGDEVLRKSDGEPLMVLSIEEHIGRKTVLIYCDDGQEYHHREVK